MQRLVADAVKAHQDGGVVKVPRQTVGEFLDKWLEDSAKPTLRPRTYASYAEMVKVHIKPAIGHHELIRLTPQHVQKFLNDLARKPQRQQPKAVEGEPVPLPKVLSVRTCLYARAILRRALGQGVKWQMLTRNVAALVDPPKMERTEIRPLDADSARALLEAVKGKPHEALFSVALAVGLRLGEALGLRWQDVDLKAGTLTVVYQLQRLDGEFNLVAPKSEKSRRTIPLPSQAVEALKDHRLRQEFQHRPGAGEHWKSWGLVFMSDVGTPLDKNNVRKAFHSVLSGAGLPQVRFHDLRHTCASLLLAQGVPARVVMEVLGHSEISLTLNTYSHVSTLVLQDAADKMTAALTATDRTATVAATG